MQDLSRICISLYNIFGFDQVSGRLIVGFYLSFIYQDASRIEKWNQPNAQ
jgi:hypothetical protein